MRTRRNLLVGGAALFVGAALTVPAAANDDDQLPALLKQWEAMWHEATRLEEIRRMAAEEMEAAGLDNHMGCIMFKDQVWNTAADIEAYYAPQIANGAFFAERARDRYKALLQAKQEARGRWNLDELEPQASAAWYASDEAGEEIIVTPATTPAGIVAKARFALLNILWPDHVDTQPDDWPPEARALASLIENAEKMGGAA